MSRLRGLAVVTATVGILILSQDAASAGPPCNEFGWQLPLGPPGECIPCDETIVPPYVPNPEDDPCRWW